MSSEPSYTIVGINFYPEPTGNAPYNTDLAEELSKFSNVTVITGVPHYPWWKKQKDHSDHDYKANHPRLRLVRRNHLVPRSQSNFLRAAMEISFGINVILSGRLRGSSVILVSPAMLSSAIALLWLKVASPKTKVLLWVQDLYEQGLIETAQVKGLASKAIAAIENWLLREADHVVMAHPVFLKAKRLDESEKSKFSAIANWSQFSFQPTDSEFDTRKRYQVGDSTLVLHIGNMGVKQGLENVVEAAQLAAVAERNIVFMLVGGGNQLEKLKSASEGLTNIKFVPPVSESELANLLQAADVLLVNEKTGVKEMSIPSKLTTYFLAGNPVLVCSEKDSLAGKTVVDNGIGYWVQSGEPNALLAKIESLDLEESKLLASRAKKFAQENLSKEAALLKFRQRLQNL
jgi:colanic acid biosynthesis glycosyl transferase WcaI